MNIDYRCGEKAYNKYIHPVMFDVIVDKPEGVARGICRA